MAKKKIILWVEEYLLRPNILQKFISFLLLPFTFLYCLFVTLKRVLAKPIEYKIPIISVGNLIVGGSGKTPLIQSFVKNYDKSAIILRGYKRESKGLHVISHFGELKASLQTSGDEAMLYALTCKALVIVSEDRAKGIKKAKSLGAKQIFLDDGFSKANIKKYDILIAPNPYPKNHFCLPSGGFREPKSFEKYANLILKENKDFTRQVHLTNPTQKMVLVTAIANASRLDAYLPKEVIKKEIFPDHHSFTKEELEQILKSSQAHSILTTRKDWVKMRDFNLPLSFLELELHVNLHIKKKIDDFVRNYENRF